jgi:hypothetical protein
MEADAMIGIAQEGFPAGARFQDPVLVFLAQILDDTTAAARLLLRSLSPSLLATYVPPT